MAGAPLADAPDPYTVRPGEAREPPTTARGRLRHLGPSVVVAGSIVGSGEIILTAGLGAAAGFVLLWWVLLSCWIKSLVQAELARYVIASGDTYLRAMNRLPGKIPLPRGRLSAPVALHLVAFVPGVMALGGILGGAGQALSVLVPALPSTWATGAIAAAVTAVLLTGSYRVLERVMIALVAAFAGATLVCAGWMQFTEFRLGVADLAAGLAFDFPVEVLGLALAVYGYTGVNAGETSAYTYWCVEKGYPSHIGPADAPGWEPRARGWIRVLQADVWLTLAILTCATLPFYVLGAGVLHALELRPQGLQTLSVLSEMFRQTLGPWSRWLFGVGAFCILFSTALSGVAAGSRLFPDYLIELGLLRREELDTRRVFTRWYGALVPLLGFALYLGVQNPVFMVSVGGMTYALLLPLQSGAVLWLQRRHLDPRVRPGGAVRAALWGIFAVQVVLAGLVIRYVVL